MAILEKIKGPEDLKKLDLELLPELCGEIRQRVIDVTSRNGGHIGPNLGVVELTVALHRVFDSPTDRFVFDVSHQGYVHKLLTGRNDGGFDRIRQTEGYSGFLNRSESEHDHYGAGHAGTALSAALGMATARDLRQGKEHVVAICGDAAFTCGITLEALNNVKSSTERLVVILNDNEWSIDRNVGAIAHYLNELITTPAYNRMQSDLEHFLRKVPGGNSLIRFGSKWKRETKDFFVSSSSLFENFGVRYIGPIDGHDLESLEQYLEFAKQSPEPLILHVITRKGNGYEVAIQHPEKFHGTSPFEIETGASKGKSGGPPAYQDVFGKTLLELARKNPSIVGITGAMPSGTGLKYLRDELPSQYFDVGIAEEHAALFAAGMATNGLRPVCAIYSTFLQRAYDPIIHDICLQNLPVLFCMDRAGLSPNDGATHHGLFDIAYLRCVPKAVVMQPKDEDELADMILTGSSLDGPAFIRYPRGRGEGVPMKKEPMEIPIGKAELLKAGQDIVIWALGPMVQEALELARTIESERKLTVGVTNGRFAKPIDRELLSDQSQGCSLIVTMEDHVKTGGFGSAVLEALSEMGISVPVERIGWPDRFVDHASSVEHLRRENGLSSGQILKQILTRWDSLSHFATPLPASPAKAASL